MAKVRDLVKMKHTKYIKFDYGDNDYFTSTVEVIERVFRWYLFTVNFRGFSVEKYTFEERWDLFERFIRHHYDGHVTGFSNHMADMIVLDNFTYNTIYNDFDCYDDMLNEIKSLFNSGNCNYLKCDISFVDEIDVEEDWNSETIYLDMTTGYIEVR